MKNNNVSDTFNLSTYMVIYKNNLSITYQKGDDKFEYIFNNIVNTFNHSKQMPALGVSLDKETKKNLQNGLWIEFIFDTTQTYNDMPFDSLLFEINPDFTGINIIRKYNGKYDGRCFYLDLNTSLCLLHHKITNLVI